MYGYGLIGNCQSASLISQQGSIDWLCLPRPDSPPVFGRLLDEDGGHFSITAADPSVCNQRYAPNTNILITEVQTQGGQIFQITDFLPRFEQHGRMYRPNSLFRIIEPLKGTPPIIVSCQPIIGWEKEKAKPIRGNSHLRYEIRGESLRLATNMSLTHLYEEIAFNLNEPIYLGLTWGAGIEDDLAKVTRHFLEQTKAYWEQWVKHCSIPSLYQAETIRSALTLKLHCYEDTGAILAGLTTSLPEEAGNGRNWDYRFCWLRDAYFVLSAFHNLGHFEEMEGFIKFLLNIAERQEHSRDRLRPVYRLDQTLPLPEIEHLNWAGFQGARPVRTNNQAVEHIQNDVYGEMILTLAPIFFDQRFHQLQSKNHEQLLEHLLKLCVKSISQPDAGLWELRNGWQEHSFSNLMCWAGIERMLRIQDRGFLKNLDRTELLKTKEKAENSLRKTIQEGSLRNGPKDSSFDAALLQLPIVRFPDRTLCEKTVLQVHEALKLGNTEYMEGFVYRYLRQDDFGHPKSAFLICSFWLVQALTCIGQVEKAQRIMKHAMRSANHVGLFSEHFLPEKKIQMGNFPQAYSHVGQINAAFAISPTWAEIL